MNFTLRIKNAPASAAWWYAVWYVYPQDWRTGWLAVSQNSVDFIGAGAGPGDMYVDAYDAAYARITNGHTRGYITPAEGSVWEYDFSSLELREVTGAPPPAAEQPRAAIVSIDAPTRAKAGDTVRVAVTLKNTGAAGWLGAAVAPDIVAWIDRWVAADFTTVISGSFTMPGNDVQVFAWAYHYDGTKWIFDEQKVAAVQLETVTLPSPEYRDLGATFSMEANFG